MHVCQQCKMQCKIDLKSLFFISLLLFFSSCIWSRECLVTVVVKNHPNAEIWINNKKSSKGRAEIVHNKKDDLRIKVKADNCPLKTVVYRIVSDLVCLKYDSKDNRTDEDNGHFIQRIGYRRFYILLNYNECFIPQEYGTY
jgi:hypothetical protein